jgi:hypothetical protein
MSVAEHKKYLDHYSKAIAKIQADQLKALDHLDEQREETIRLYRLFDKLVRKLKKETATDIDDQLGLKQIDAWIKEAGKYFTGMKSDLADADKCAKEAGKWIKDVDDLVDGLKEQASGKSPDKGKYKSLHDDAKKLLEKIKSDIVKHRGDAYNPDREQKDFVKEFNRFAALVASGKHREKAAEDDDDWQEGALDPKKIAETEKKVKAFETRGTRALDAITVAVQVARKGQGQLNLKDETKEMAAVLTAIDKIAKGLKTAVGKVKGEDLAKAKETDEFKAIQAMVKDIAKTHDDMAKRYRGIMGAAAKLSAEQRKAERA